MNRDSLPWRLTFGTGSRMWPKLYGDNKHRDGEAWEALVEHIHSSVNLEALRADTFSPIVHLRDKTGARPEIDAFDSTIGQHIVAAAKWVDGGCRTIRTDRTYFAAMAHTHITESIVDDMHVPYPCFVVELPDGLLVGEDGRAYEMAMFCQFTDFPVSDVNITSVYQSNASFYSIHATDGTTIHSFLPDHSLADHLFNPSPEFEPSVIERTRGIDLPELSGDSRIREMVCRATAGLLYTMQHTRNWRHGGYFDRAGGSLRDRAAPPPHRTVIVGSPLKIDVSAAVSEDARSGSHSAPSVQTLVRGHLKRQVVGAGRASRKIIWVEPYWRGPEAAPILMRPYTVSSPRK